MMTSSKLYYNDEWTDSISLPSRILLYCQVSVGNQTFVIGGILHHKAETLNSVLVLNKDSVTELPHNLTYPRGGHACVEWGGLIYVIGGIQYNFDEDTQHIIVPTVEVYNPSTPDLGWFAGPELPHGLLGATAVVHKDNLYLVGGQRDVVRREQSPDNTAVFKLDKDDDEWKTLPGVTVMAGNTGRMMPFTMDQHAPVVDGNTLHCF